MVENACAFHYDYPWPHQDLDPGCQFTEERDLFDCGDKRYCRFHLPMADENGTPTEKAKWAEEGDDSPELADFRKAIDVQIKAALDDRSVANLSGVVFPVEVDAQGRALPEVLWCRARLTGRRQVREGHV